MSLSFLIYKMGIIAEAHSCLRIRQDHLFEAFRRKTRMCPVDVSYYFRWEGKFEVSYKLWNIVWFKGIFIINNNGKCRNYGGWMHALHTHHINFSTFFSLPPFFLSCTPSVSSVQFSSVSQSCPTLCDPMNHSTPGLPVHHHLPEFTQTRIHQVFQKNIYICFIDYAKAFDSVDLNKVLKILKEMGIPEHLTCCLRNLYMQVRKATVRTEHGTTD